MKLAACLTSLMLLAASAIGGAAPHYKIVVDFQKDQNALNAFGYQSSDSYYDIYFYVNGAPYTNPPSTNVVFAYKPFRNSQALIRAQQISFTSNCAVMFMPATNMWWPCDMAPAQVSITNNGTRYDFRDGYMTVRKSLLHLNPPSYPGYSWETWLTNVVNQTIISNIISGIDLSLSNRYYLATNPSNFCTLAQAAALTNSLSGTNHLHAGVYQPSGVYLVPGDTNRFVDATITNGLGGSGLTASTVTNDLDLAQSPSLTGTVAKASTALQYLCYAPNYDIIWGGGGIRAAQLYPYESDSFVAHIPFWQSWDFDSSAVFTNGLTLMGSGGLKYFARVKPLGIGEGAYARLYDTDNPPTAAQVGAATSNHLHAGVYQPAGTYLVPGDTNNLPYGISASTASNITAGLIAPYTNHQYRVDNPHGVTAGQVGAATSADVTNIVEAARTNAVDPLYRASTNMIVVVLDGTNYTINPALGNIFAITNGGASADCQITVTNSGGYDMQRILIAVKNVGGYSNLLVGANLHYGDLSGFLFSTNVGAVDYVGMVKRPLANVWDITAWRKGYGL